MDALYPLVAVALGLGAGVMLGTRLGRGRGRGDAGAQKVAEAEADKIRSAAQAELDAIKRAAEVEGKEAARQGLAPNGRKSDGTSSVCRFCNSRCNQFECARRFSATRRLRAELIR